MKRALTCTLLLLLLNQAAHASASGTGSRHTAIAALDYGAGAAALSGWQSTALRPAHTVAGNALLATPLIPGLHSGASQEKGLLDLIRKHWVLALIDTLALLALAAAAGCAWRANRRLAREIEHRKRALEKIETLASALEQTTDTVMITNADGVIEYVNPAFTRLTGYTAEEALGRTPRLLRSGEHDTAFYAALWRTIVHGEAFDGELINRRKNGSLYWERKSIMPLRDAGGQIVHYIATGRDVTEQRRAEEDVQLRREQLAHTARVNSVGEMAASVVHEISQPLTAIINYAQGSMRRLRNGDIDTARLAGVFEQIVLQSQRAADSIVALRRFVARRKPARVRVDLNALVKQVVALAAGETRKRGIVVTLDLSPDLPPAYVDDVQIEQVILNLLRNGAEALASADGSLRELTIRTQATGDSSIEISVSDTGPGLPPRLAAKLFEPFFSTKPEGVGLGLAVSRTIIETHGGRIWVTPNTGRGVTFRFTVPIEDTHTHER